MNDKIPNRVMSVIWVAPTGFIAARVMWMMIYGIGSRVIKDQEHYDYANTVHLAGVIASSIAGIACFLRSCRPFLSAFLIHLITGISFVIIPIASWQTGIIKYFIALEVLTVITVWIFRQKQETDRSTSNCTLSTKGAPSLKSESGRSR